MNQIEFKIYKNKDYNKEILEIAEYDECTFIDCNFQGTDLSRIVFSDCTFENCDLSNANIFDTVIREIHFINCKMLGLHFEYCKNFLFAAKFENCNLDFSSFYQLMIKNVEFIECSLKSVDFTEANMSGINIQNCDLFEAIFDRTNIEKTDFRTAKNYAIDLNKNKVKKAKFSRQGIDGLLKSYNIIIE